jgi:signal transduction histidine kinase
MQARLSMATRAFLLLSLPLCLLLIASFFTINRAIRDKMEAGILESMHQTGRSVNAARAEYSAHYGDLHAFVSENGKLEGLLSFLGETPVAQTALLQLHNIIETQLIQLGQVSEYDLLVFSDIDGRPIAGCVRKQEGLVHLDSSSQTITGQAPFCAACHNPPPVNLLPVEGTLYEISNMPIRRDAKIAGYLTMGKKLSSRSPSDFLHVALVENKRVLLTTFPPGMVGELEHQFQTKCAGEIDGCEIQVKGITYLGLEASGETLAGNSNLYAFQSMDGLMSAITPRVEQAFWLMGAGGILVVLLYSMIASNSLRKPITKLVDQLKASERTGTLRSDFVTNSPAQEVNLLAEALNRAAEAIRRSHDELQALAGRLLSAKEEENRRLARELHDVVSQRLAVLGMEFSAVQQQLASSSPLVSGRLGSMAEEVGRVAKDIHQLSRQMHPSILDDLGLTSALRAECAAFSKQHGIAAELVPSEIPDALPGEIALSLYRIVQESLWNVAKHAHAHQVRLSVAQADGELLLSVEDDGKGFDPEQVKGQGGLGLVSMEERVRLVNGRFSIQSHPGNGTRVEVRVPVPHPGG